MCDIDTWVGRHNNRFLGVGYFVSTFYLYCGDLIVPVFTMVFPANTSDKVMFHDTIVYYLQQGFPKPRVILGDCGGYSLENQRYLGGLNIIGVLNAPKTVTKQPMMEIDANHRFNRKFLPPSWSEEDVRWLCNLRTAIERQFSHNNVVYHARHLNVREITEVAKHREMLVILDLLRIWACIRFGRGDLLLSSISFSLLRMGISVEWRQDEMKNAGFQIFDQTELTKPDGI